MEQDNIKENQIKNEAAEAENENLSLENPKVVTKDSSGQEEIAVEATNKLENQIEEESNKASSFSIILANFLDQTLIVAASSLLVLLCDLVLRLFGYMFIRDNGAVILAGGIIYFILNCIYVPLIEKSKLKSTIGKKILNIK